MNDVLFSLVLMSRRFVGVTAGGGPTSPPGGHMAAALPEFSPFIITSAPSGSVKPDQTVSPGLIDHL